jgi:hypothetical protein
MGAHIEAKHPSVALSSTFEVSFDITQDERTNHHLESKAAVPAKKGTKQKLSKGNSDLGAKQGQKQPLK